MMKMFGKNLNLAQNNSKLMRLIHFSQVVCRRGSSGSQHFIVSSYKRLKFSLSSWLIFALMIVFCREFEVPTFGQSDNVIGWDPYLTFSGNFDVDYQRTQFYSPNQNALVGDWDTRLEVWLPPFRTGFSWGPYLRFAGIDSS